MIRKKEMEMESQDYDEQYINDFLQEKR